MPKIFDQLQEQYKNILISSHSQCGDHTIVISRENFKRVVLELREHPDWKLDTLMDLTAVDYLPENREVRFEMVYHFYSMVLNRRLRIKVPIAEGDAIIETLSDVWPHANWYEREVWDMFGIKFENHPDMRRLLLYEEFEGHPLRKDYPFNKQQPLLNIDKQNK